MNSRAPLLALALCAAACSSTVDPLEGRLWTMSDLIGAHHDESPDVFVAPGDPLRFLSAPFSLATNIKQDPAIGGLTVFPAYLQADVSAFVTTEVWDEFPRIWAQPVYVPVTSVDPVTGPQLLAGAKPVFGVPGTSRFYSPYWITWYVVVPSGFNGTFTSVAQVLDSHYPLVQGPNAYWSLCPANVSIAHEDGKLPVRPFTYEPLKQRTVQEGWVDGNPVFFLSFGRDRFTTADSKVVTEVAQYRFALRGPDGLPIPLDLPPVTGTGARGAPKAISAPNNIPQFGALSHEFYAMLQTRPTDPLPGVFVPLSLPALRAKIASEMGSQFVPEPGPVAEALPERDQFILRVAIDGSCFTAGDFPAGCTWLDTQANVENLLPVQAIYDTHRFSATAIVLFGGGAL